MSAPAGYGKTSALARSLALNDDGALGTDLWLQCGRRDSDSAVLANGLAESVGLATPTGDWTGTGADLADALLRFAPQQVCLVLDDVHRIADGSPGMALLQDLVDALPHHAHLLLSGRRTLPLRLARLRADARCETLGPADLEFNAEEVVRACGASTESTLARWPAMSGLIRADHPDASADYLLEEVAESLGAQTLTALTALSYLRAIDDDLATAAYGAATTAEHLLADLPLVVRSSDGSFQMHDLWHEALVRTPELTEATRDALSRMARSELERGADLQAAEHFAAADDHAGLADAAVAILGRPMIMSSAAEHRALAALVDPLANRPLSMLVNATVPMTRDERASADAFDLAGHEARLAGEHAIEVAALQNELNLRSSLQPRAMPARLLDRVGELYRAHPEDETLRPLHAVARMFASMHSDEPEDAARHVSELRPSASPFERIMLAFALSDLGRPEEVMAPDPSEGAPETVARLGGQYMGQAMWLRGDASPELALEVSAAMAAATTTQGAMAHVQISTNSVFALVSLAAGDIVGARRCADDALRLVSRTAMQPVRAFATLADAAVVMFEQGEEAAASRLEQMLRTLPLGRWPARPYLYALELLYVLAPSTRSALARCRFGPALSAARDAGIALVSLRDDVDAVPAAALPWHRPWLLRAHVLPPHLVELAAAAASAGVTEAGQLLDEVPNAREHLVTLAKTPAQPGARWAKSRAAQLPARPGYDVSLGLLGPARCRLDDMAVSDPNWLRRERVRELFAVLVLHRHISRSRVGELLWPALEPEKAADNVRVTLSYLHKVLEPGRGRNERPWFIRADRESISVHPVGLTVDAEQFDGACRAARQLDESGRGTRAIARYRQAAELYQGGYATDWPEAEWAETERLRLHVLAVSSLTRLGELLLACGEPEEAGTWATKAIRMETVDERSHRLLARSLAALGNEEGARRALKPFARRLQTGDLKVERETLRLLDAYRSTD